MTRQSTGISQRDSAPKIHRVPEKPDFPYIRRRCLNLQSGPTTTVLRRDTMILFKTHVLKTSSTAECLLLDPPLDLVTSIQEPLL